MYAENDVINGLYGFVYDENGQQVQSAQSFESTIEFDKEDVKQAGKFMTGHKVTGGSGSGSMTIHKLDSRLQLKVANNPHGKYNYISKLADPTANGEEAVMLKGVSFDSVELSKFELGALVDAEFPFTFDDFEYLQTMV